MDIDQRDEIRALTDKAEELRQILASQRTPSKAHLIGSPDPYADHGESDNIFGLIARAQSVRLAGGATGMLEAKASLDALGVRWSDVHPDSKATLGDTDAAGGYLIPNNLVATLRTQAQPGRSMVDLFTVVTDVRGAGVDQPWEQSADTRALIAAPGATKENSNLIVNNYTATLYTMARIFDIGNQLLRQSAGAAEEIVRSKLARGMVAGEDYYALQGSGSSQPYGLLTALGTSGTYVTSHSPSASTVAGNWASAIAKAAAAVADRGGVPDGVIMNSSDYWTSLTSGADAAGFYVDPQGGGFTFSPNAATTGAGPWGLRLRHTPNMPSDSLVVGDFKSAFFFRGQSYRVDVSSEAGDRWDKNLTGFRGEEEIAFDARPYVYTGYFQRITNVMP